jgi:hypothetical protein
MAEKKEKKVAAAPLQVGGDIPMFIPKESKTDDTLYVNINGVKGLIRKGETVYLSEPFAELIRNSMAAQKAADRFIANNSN